MQHCKLIKILKIILIALKINISKIKMEIYIIAKINVFFKKIIQVKLFRIFQNVHLIAIKRIIFIKLFLVYYWLLLELIFEEYLLQIKKN